MKRVVPLVVALAALLFAAPASAQQCPASEFGKSCGPGGSAFPGLPAWAGLCIQSTCSSENPDDGAVTEQPCGFCEPVACPTSEIGQPCEGGICTQATCRGADDAGNGTSQACGVCISPSSDCTSANDGAPCGDGGTCMMASVRALGPAGSPPAADLFYSAPQCVVPAVVPEGGTFDIDASLGGTPHAADGSAALDAGATSTGAASTSSSKSGCGVAPGAGPRGLGFAFAASVLLGRLRRRRRS
jgi:hypothetical protein